MRYSDEISKLLDSAGAKEGSLIQLTVDGKEYKGTLMHRNDAGDPGVIVIKLKNGYYVGFRTDKNTKIKVLGQPTVKEKKKKEQKFKKGLPTLTVIGTGGTIGSVADAGSGALNTGLTASDIIDLVPEVLEAANIKTRDVSSVFSENIDSKNWKEIAAAVEEELNGGSDGVIILHGTDTIGYTAAALSFMLGETGGPVVLVGAQRSTDRPSSDAPGNILAAVRFCVSKRVSGVYVIMHDTISDDSFAVHHATRVRKMHTSGRDAVRSINAVPAAHIDGSGNITMNDELPAVAKKTKAHTKMEKSVVLLQFYPGMDPSVFKDVIKGSKGAVIAGTGLGHVSSAMAKLLKDAIGDGTVVIMTSQCINGPTGMNVYASGRELQRMGIIPVLDMLPETAYVKLMWALANSKNVKETMTTKLANEMGERRGIDVSK